MDRLTRLFVACACLTTAACQNPDAILLTVGADAAVEQYDLYVRDEKTKEVIFHSTFNPVSKPGEAPKDLRTDKLKLAIKLSRSGDFKLLLVGVIGQVENGGRPAPGATQLFWAGRVKVEGTANIDARLLTVPDGNDTDRDLWPDRDTWLAANAEAANLYRGQESLLDCNDKTMNPTNTEGMPLTLEPGQVNPFAKEVCTEKYDRDCDGEIAPCVDEDGDGDFAGSDCDDNDPARHKPTAADPYPDPPNCCGYSLGMTGADARVNFLGQAICPTARCGDGIDQSCSGRDTNCVVDADCDNVPPPPMGNDCDDNDPNTYPGALEPCGSTKDLNCSGKVNDGCVPCDLDGDGFQRMDVPNGCPDMNNNGKPIDCNDYDAGIYPGQSSTRLSSSNPSTSGMKEAGNDEISRIVAALRGNCRRVYQATGTTGTAKIAITGFSLGDADCNGTAFEGCPSVACDADGDGWPNANTPTCNPTGLALDCNDNDPTVFPGAPDKCGNGIAENCTADSACANDADGDGYPATFDCNDQNPMVHPWATELCNGVDDDCDGLTDEGNPDPSGAPLVTTGAITECTTSDIGECGKTKGLCVCSVAGNNATPDPQNRRTWCPGEQNAAAGSRFAQCYGAGQPHPQTCDAANKRDDDCDGRNDDPTGTNIGALKGMQCGFNQGQCKQGTIVGCDYSRDNVYFTFGLTAAPGGSATTRGYVCSNDTVNPSTEVCDGIDNDCRNDQLTNTLPDERDRDLDKWLACSPFVGVASAAVLGGGDCNDNPGLVGPIVYPGAPELCDNIDNNCVNGITDDGATQCVGGTPTCCSSQGACRNLTNDFNNCTACGMVCSTLTANNCGMGGNGCRCGNNPACSLGAGLTPGAWCNAASCETCNTKQHCGANCVDCGANVCKTDGSGCTECNNDGDCPASKWCNSGVCTDDRIGGQACTRNEQCAASAPNCIDTGPGTKVCCAQATCGTCSTCASGTCQNATPGSTQPGCMGVNVCNNGACGLAVGQPCPTGGCAFGNCVDGVCCMSSCNGSCQRCAMGTGACGSVTNATDDTCDSGGTRICNASGVCKAVNGQNCTVPAASDCLSGNCVDGKCCDQTSAVCGTCRTCNGSTPGTCQAVGNLSQDTGCNTTGFSCDGTNNGAASCVRDNGIACSGGTQCRSGVCLTNCCSASCPAASCNDSVAPATTTVYNSCAAGTGSCVATNDICTMNRGCLGTSCAPSCTNGSTTGCTVGFCCKTGACVDLTQDANCGSTCATCTGGTPKCVPSGVAGAYQCGICKTDADCGGSQYCAADFTCKSRQAMGACVVDCASTNPNCKQCSASGGSACSGGMCN